MDKSLLLNYVVLNEDRQKNKKKLKYLISKLLSEQIVYCTAQIKLLIEVHSKAESPKQFLWVFSCEEFSSKRSKTDGLKWSSHSKCTAAIYCHLLLYYLLSD